MKICEKRKVQQVQNKNTLLVSIPKIIVSYLGLEKSDKLVFKNEESKIVIEKEKEQNDKRL